jgi:hypothetical protein
MAFMNTLPRLISPVTRFTPLICQSIVWSGKLVLGLASIVNLSFGFLRNRDSIFILSKTCTSFETGLPH